VKLSKAQLRGGPFKAGYRVHELPYRRGLNEGTPHCDPWRNPYLQRGVPAGGDAELSQVTIPMAHACTSIHACTVDAISLFTQFVETVSKPFLFNAKSAVLRCLFWLFLF